MSGYTLHGRAEWTPHSGIILGWPGLEGILKDYPEFLARATQEVSNIAQAVARLCYQGRIPERAPSRVSTTTSTAGAANTLRRLPANDGIILPQFGDPAHDAAAIRVTQTVFGEERRIHPVLIEQLPVLGGGVHCATQEIPELP